MSRHTRRALIGTIGSLTVAGCTGQFGSPDGSGNETDTGTPTGTGQPTAAGTDTATAAETTTPSSSSGRIGTQFEDFEDLERWYALQGYGEVSATSNDAYQGSQSMRLQSSGDVAAGYHAFTSPKDMSGKNVSLAVKVNSPLLAKLRVELLAPDRGNKVVMGRTMQGPTDTWVRLDMGVTQESREPELSAVQEVRVIAQRTGGSEPVDVVVDDLRLVDRPEKAYVMLGFNDAYRSHYETVFPMMQEFGFSGVEGVVSDVVYGQNRLDVGMMREMRDAGWDMASRPGAEDYLPQLSAERQRELFERNKQFLARKGFPDGAKHFITPYGRRSAKTMEIVGELHETMFTYGGMPNGLPSTTLQNLSFIDAGNTQPVKTLVDLAAKYNQFLVATTGSVGSDEDSAISESDLRAFLEYVDAADIEVVTATDMLEMQGQA